jgi:hypothetical protein
MERRRSVLKHFVLLISAAIFLFAGCKNSPTEPSNAEPTTDQDAMLKIADEDSALTSFDSNYNEDNAMSFMGKISTAIYPLKAGLRVHIVNRTMSTDIIGDTAYATLTKTYEGVLLISASYDSANSSGDSLISKPFTSAITRKLIFVKIANTGFPLRNWRIAAISLPEGGTTNHPNINIEKVTVFLPGGDILIVTSPNNYFLARGRGWWRQIPLIPRNHGVKVQVELFSVFSDDDFVTLTYGADFKGLHRAKQKLELISSSQVNGGYDKIYEQTYNSNQFPGYYHAIINAFPRQVIYDDSTPVENDMWGIPYAVTF